MNEFKTGKGVIIFDEVPENVDRLEVFEFKRTGRYYGNPDSKGLSQWKRPIPKGFDLIGICTLITEEEAKMMVDSSDIHGLLFKDVNGRHAHMTALGAFKSIMIKIKIACSKKTVVLFATNR